MTRQEIAVQLLTSMIHVKIPASDNEMRDQCIKAYQIADIMLELTDRQLPPRGRRDAR